MNQHLYLKTEPIPVIETCGWANYYPDEYHVRRKINTHVLIFMMENELYFTEDGAEKVVRPGEVYLQRAHLQQDATRPSPGARYFWMHFRAETADDPSACKAVPVPVHSTFSEPEYHMYFSRLFACRYAGEHLFQYQGQFLVILDQLCQEFMRHDYLNNDIADSVHRYIDKHYREQDVPQKLEQRFGYTYDYLRRIFTDKYGVTPIQHLRTVRNMAARELLQNTSKALREVAADSGFESEIALLKSFKKEFGMPPREFRKQSAR